MRDLRWLTPGTTWFVTSRSTDGIFLLRPDDACRSVLLYWLARALRTHERVKLISIVQMSNHIHLIVRDEDSDLSKFMGYFLGNFARAVNRIRARRGPVFERRFSSEPILDDESIVDKTEYCICNPLNAALVNSPDEWPGVCLWQAGTTEVVWFDELRYRRDSARHPGKTLDRARYTHLETLTIEATLEPDEIEELKSRIAGRTKKHTTEKRAVLGARQVLAQSPFDRPRELKRTPRPLCHTSCTERFLEFREKVRELRRDYRDASEAFRKGQLEVTFPSYVFRPWLR